MLVILIDRYFRIYKNSLALCTAYRTEGMKGQLVKVGTYNQFYEFLKQLNFQYRIAHFLGVFANMVFLLANS